MAEGQQVPWPSPPREPGPWGGGPPVAPPGNTPLPPLPGAGGTMHTAAASTNPWASAGTSPYSTVPPPAVNQNPFPGLSSRPPLVDRAPGWILGLSIAVVVCLVAGGAYIVLSGGSKFPKEWDSRVASIASWVEDERHLSYDHPVEVKFLTAAEYSKEAGGDPEEDPTAESKEQMQDQVAQLRALGFLSGDVDLDKASRTLSDSGSLAFYSPDTEKVYVRGTKLTPGLKVTLAHELTHVLQDQHFDLERVSGLEASRGDVLRALAEGDAGRIEDKYIEDELSDSERMLYEKESSDESNEAQEKLEKEVPPILTTVFAAPYILGPSLIEYLDYDGETAAIDAALTDPPTEEVLFNPTLWKSKAAEPVEVTMDTPGGKEPLDAGQFGPTAWYLLLATRVDPKQALQAADGWGGDHYAVYKDDTGKVCVDADVKFDSDGDRAQFHTAMAAWVGRSPKGTAEITTKGDVERLHSCDPGKDAKPVGNKVGPELLTLPSLRTQAFQAALGQSKNRLQASCFGQGIVDTFSIQQLTGDYLGSDEGQQALEAIRTRCG